MTCAPFHCQLLLPLVSLSLLSSSLVAAGKFDLSPAQQARIEKYLPHSFEKLVKQEPIHVIIFGDDVAGMKVHNGDEGNTLKSFAGNFVSILADQFFYGGGVRVVRPPKGQPEKVMEITGPEIGLRNASRTGRLMIHALSELSATVWDESPDILIVNFGVNDAIEHHSLASYRRAIQNVIDLAHQHKADILLLGPTLTLTEPVEQGLALTRGYADTMREVAEKNLVFFADLGDIAWLSRVDERMKGLERPVEKKKTDAVTDKQPAVAPGSIINIPMPEELDPDPDKRAARLFRQVSTDLQKWFDHGRVSDPVHPNSAMHRFLGRRIYAELIDGPRQVPWTIGPVQAVFKGPGECEVSYRVENNTKAPLRVTTLPLVTHAWKPQEAETQVELRPAQKALVTVTYRRTENVDATPSNESVLRLPVLVLGESWTRIEDLRAVIQPCSVQWHTGAQFNVENEFSIEATITNPGAQTLNGTWEASWLGQQLGGKFSATARGHAPVKLRFTLPAASTTATRQKGTLKFVVTADGLSLPFNREIEIAQNIGLKQSVPLFPRGQYLPDNTPAVPVPGPSQPG
ncbi:MAG: SGNH/GDSL hydrolase family protein, partial [Verrucomicrobiaceae bacterium]